ncbi:MULTISPECIES: NUDIX hydrolase [Bacillaceae]|uniref:NUDIX hydrolase n=1 Tax=Bacillaceae TaxID=186817 RepID=UPI002A0DBFA2|nr:NUDIX domain-containing protein [Cytobacillus sp. IB215316]MDX8362601.1 NUDIX domain-containing protein [Cytobacillus sp. IB215316]
MEKELIKVFDESQNECGVATRDEVHKFGYWHETFHCWFISKDNGKDYIYFQKRSAIKKDYPNLLDITAAGHILANETMSDGVREVHEELGIQVTMEELVSLGIFKYCVIHEQLVDKEIANVFLFDYKSNMENFKLQKEEVSGIVKADFNHFSELWLGGRTHLNIVGFEIDENGRRLPIDQIVSKAEFVPHEQVYYESIISKINKYIKKN